ncbi:MAG: TonB-dependent receptor [Cyclobacteriaceae bacterium]
MKKHVSTHLALFLTLTCCFVGISSVSAQTNKITGRVIDEETGEGLPGATIILKGTSIGEITDIDGNYSINTVGDNPQLQFSFIGYEGQTIDVGNRTTIDVSLGLALGQLDEVVVVGYGTMKRSDLTGAVSSLKGSAFQEGQPVSFQNALAGRVAGVQVTQTDNAPGSGVNIIIRGGSSLTSGNQPLYVIDGFPIIPDSNDPSTNPLADIGTNQIESMEILKDASATAIYGAQGANGVIIITTKRGKNGKPRINVDVNHGVSMMDNAPDVLSPDEFVDFQIRTIEAYKYSSTPVEGNSEEFWRSIGESGLIGKSWIDEITRAAKTTSVNVDFNGGSDGFKYALAANYLDQEGVVLNSGFERVNLNVNLEQSLNKKTKIGTSIKLSTTRNYGLVNTWEEGAIIKQAFQSNPFVLDDSDLTAFNENSPVDTWNNEDIVSYLDNVDNGFETTRMIGNLFYEQELIEGLNFYTSYGFNLYGKDAHSFLPKSTRAGTIRGGQVSFRKEERKRYVYQARLNYTKSLGKHNINATTAFETTKNEWSLFTTGVEGFEDDSRGIYDLSSASTPYLPSNVYQDNNMMSYLGRLSYSFAGKYLLTTSLRADGSSLLGAGNRWDYFPSVALGWVASNEKFIENLGVFDLLKIRASYGVTGNNQIQPYSSLASLRTERYIFNDDDRPTSGVVPGSIANPNLTWERTDQYNLGMDIGFFKSRLLITAEVYYKETNDLLLEVQLPPTSGFPSAIQNIGSISNRGFELSINTVNIDKGKFNWTSAFTFSTNRSKILKLGDTQEMFFTRNWFSRVRDDVMVREGDQIGIYYGYIEDEILNSGNEIANSPFNEVLENTVGQMKYYDVNGDGVINQADKVPLAKTVPDFIGGLNNQLTYGNWDLNFFFRWSYGNDVINGNITFLDAALGYGNWNTLESLTANNYTPLNTDGTVHGRVQDTYLSNMRSGVVEDGSYLKLDYITLGYKLPQTNVLDKVGIRNFRVYGRVSNPLMFTRYSWFDPEVSTGFGTVARVGPGADVGTYPRAKTYTIGLSIGL